MSTSNRGSIPRASTHESGKKCYPQRVDLKSIKSLGEHRGHEEPRIAADSSAAFGLARIAHALGILPSEPLDEADIEARAAEMTRRGAA